MPRYYVDLDNNRLVTGPQSTQLASTPKLYQGDKPVLDVELLTRTNGVLGYYTSTASAINARVGTLGGSAVASALTLSTVTLSITATATAGLASPITATGTATLLGSITATATAGVNNPSVITITPTVTTWASAVVCAFLGQEAIAPVIQYSLTPSQDKYLDVVEAGTPYDASTSVFATITTANQTLNDILVFSVPKSAVSGAAQVSIVRATTTAGIWNNSDAILQLVQTTTGTPNSGTNWGFQTTTTNNALVVNSSAGFLTNFGSWVNASSVTANTHVNLLNGNYAQDSSNYYFSVAQPVTSSYSYTLFIAESSNNSWSSTTSLSFTNSFNDANKRVYVGAINAEGVSSGSTYLSLTSKNSLINLYLAKTTVGLNTISAIEDINFSPSYIPNFSGAGYSFTWTGNINDNSYKIFTYLSLIGDGKPLTTTVTAAGPSTYSGDDVSLLFETMPDGRKQITGGSIDMASYKHQPHLALPKTGTVSIYPEKAYPNRRVARLEISSCGSQYLSVPSVIISEPDDENGICAKATASLSAGKISGVTITEPGSGYTQTPDVFVLPQAEAMKSAAPRSVTSVVTAVDRRLVLALGSGVTISDNSWCMLSGLGKADGLAYVVTVATGGTQTTLKFPFDLGSVTTTAAATLAPLIPYVRVTGATITGTDASFMPGSTIPVSFSSPSCGDTDAVANFSVLNSGALALSTIPTPGFAQSFSVATLTAYKKITGLTVTCAGAGYWTSLPAITVDNGTYVATAPGAIPASVTASLNGTGGIVLTITSAGYGYTSAPTVSISAPNGGDGVRKVTLGTSGVGYSDGTFACSVATAPAGGATAVINFVKSGTSQGFVVADPGRGYTSAPAVTVAAPDLGGQVSSFTITSAGAGYSDAPSITITGGGGSGASAAAILTNGTVTSISLTSAGSGYTNSPSLIFSAPPASVYYSKQIDLSSASAGPASPDRCRQSLLKGGSRAQREARQLPVRFL
ncbi:hypothetical protein EBZ39_04235 [bacterium]|nr:hypothetical protein [bacterium]